MKKPLITKFNRGQRQILRAGPKLLASFLRHEWMSAGLGFCSGALVGAAATFFGTYAGAHTQWTLNDPNLTGYWKLVNTYVPNFWFILAPLALIALLKMASI